MNVISFKEYARIHNVSYEAVRRQVARYAHELEGHVIKDGRQQFLDEEAVAFLDERRQKNPVVIYQESKDEELARLRAEKEALLEDLNMAKDRIIAQQDRLHALSNADQKIQLLEANSKASEERAIKAEERARAAEDDLLQTVNSLELMRGEAKMHADEALEAEERARAAEDVAELNAQEAERVKAEAAALRAQLDEIAGAGRWQRKKLVKKLRKEHKNKLKEKGEPNAKH